MTSKERKLMSAIKADKVEVARFILKSGVEVNTRDELGNTAVMGVRSVEMLNLCLEYGANLNMKNKKLDSVLTVWAKRLDKQKCREMHLSPLNETEFSAIWKVARRKDIDLFSKNSEMRTAKSYLDENNPNQRALVMDLHKYEKLQKVKEAKEQRSNQQEKPEGKQ